MTSKFCQICNKPSGMYPLCKEHLKMKDEGKVIKDNNGKWILKEFIETPFSFKNKTNTCLLCGADIKSEYKFYCRFYDDSDYEYNTIAQCFK